MDSDFTEFARARRVDLDSMATEHGVSESLGDLRPTLGSKRDQGKSVRKWRKARGLDEQDMDNDNLYGGRPDDEVKFFIDSEPAYYAVMDRFGDHIEFRGEDMVAPLRLWGAIQQTAGDAGGAADIAGLEDEPMWVGDELDEQDMSDGSYDKLSLFQRVFPNEQLIQQAQDSINQRMMQAGEDNPAIKYLDNAYNILSLMYSNPTEKLASEFYNNIRRARDVEQQGLAENYPKHQDLSGISTDKLKAYVAKYTSHPMSGEGAQVRRVRAELERRSQGMAEGFFDRFKKKLTANRGGIDLTASKEDGRVIINASSQGKRLGIAMFNINGKTLVADRLMVQPEYRGQGIAEIMYDWAKELGYTVQRSSDQTADGKRFWNKLKGEETNVWEQGVAEGSDRIAANKQDRLQALENKLKAKGYARTKDSDGGEYQYRWTRDGAPSYVVNYRSGANGYAEFRKEQGVSEGHGNYAGDRPVNLGGVSMKKIQIGDTVRYIDQKAQVVDMSRDREHARITIPSSATTKTVLTSDLRQLGRGVSEGNDQQLSVQQLATISDEALDNAYGYGRSSPGNTFGWQANLKSAAYAKQMIDRGATDIEAISDAIHQGWNTTAKAFVQNPEQFDDTEKLRAAGKLEAKLQQRAKLMNINYDQLPDDEQEKDRVVARALLQALTGRQDMAEAGYDSGDYSNDRQSDDYGRDLVPTGSGGSRFVNHGAHDHTRGRPAKTHGFSKNLPADPFGRTAGKIPHSARPKQELDPFRELDELSPATLARYKTKAGAAATAADSTGDRKTGDRRFSGIVKATKKQFDQDAKQSAQAVHESRLSVMASIIKGQ
jgi:GNAT superfamily N-acetyltransferase